eukprot:gnl/TRDRNA2_/TRDRNA2_82936_c0_seq1.p1 gnl/TRDRNA2_/TRDRNA2_82936_c0~~gnl/TRDRNA2_/TRDRNA2_82936_c0_seq1.p1  ORF type:complete len:188 (+),score=20.81 gnl/TRDRNA2_/TRDRNA2_82936_c0_seq1:41-604(+)
MAETQILVTVIIAVVVFCIPREVAGKPMVRREQKKIHMEIKSGANLQPAEMHESLSLTVPASLDAATDLHSLEEAVHILLNTNKNSLKQITKCGELPDGTGSEAKKQLEICHWLMCPPGEGETTSWENPLDGIQYVRADYGAACTKCFNDWCEKHTGSVFCTGGTTRSRCDQSVGGSGAAPNSYNNS